MRRLLFAALLFVAAWLTGLVAFVATLPAPSAPAAQYAAKGAKAAMSGHDAVIVYTGGGGKRISAGMALLNAGAAKRLLISGVNPDTTRSNLVDLWHGEKDVFDCCVDLGREAKTTIGNAREAAQWSAQQNAASIILVTSDYHMPRALAETRRRMPAATVTPYPVASGFLGDTGKPSSGAAWRQIAGEYNKYLLAGVRRALPFIGS